MRLDIQRSVCREMRRKQQQSPESARAQQIAGVHFWCPTQHATLIAVCHELGYSAGDVVFSSAMWRQARNNIRLLNAYEQPQRALRPLRVAEPR